MKKFAIISAILGVMALGMAIYLHFVVAENAAIAESAIEYSENLYGDDFMRYYSTPEYKENFAAMELRTDMGMLSVLIGALVLIIGIVPVIKKKHLGWIGIVGGLAALMMGLVYGTHMF